MSDAKRGKSFLPPDALRFAKQLGIDLDGLEPEAKEIWNQLNALSMENPVEYQRFVSEQMQLAKEENEGRKTADKGRSFRPDAAFFIETNSFGGDGLKIRDESVDSQKKKLFVNFCSSALIEDPKDKSGKVIDLNMETADGLQIPLIIGKVRKIDAEVNAVDIVMSPKVIELCGRQRYFKQQLIELGLDWLQQESDLKFDKKNTKEDDKYKYRGGLGEEKDIPVLFHIDEDMLQPPNEKDGIPSSTSNDKKRGELLSSTKSLLAHLQKEKEGPEPTLTETQLPFQQSSEQPNKKKPIIQEVLAETSYNQIREDHSFKTGGKSVSFVDEKLPTSSNTLSETLPLASQASFKAPSKFECKQFLDVFQSFDREMQGPGGADEDVDGTLLKDLAKALVNPRLSDHQTSNISQPASDLKLKKPTPNDVESIVISNANPNLVQLGAAFGKDESGKSWNLTVTLEGLSQSVKASSIDIQVSAKEVIVSCPLNCFEKGINETGNTTIKATYQGKKLSLNGAKTSASLKKKQGKMLIVIGCDKKQ